MRTGWPLLAVAGLLACSPSSEADAPEGAELGPEAASELDLVCHAELRSGAIERFPFADKAQTIQAWLDPRLKDERVRAFYFEELPQTAIDFQDDRLRQVAADTGVGRCPMADLIEFLGRLPRAGFTFDDCVSACVARHPEHAEAEQACPRGCGR